MNKPTLRTVIFLVMLGLILAGAAWYFFAPSGQPGAAAVKPAVAASAKPALTVTAAQPQTVSLPIKLSANGNVTAWQEAIVGSESAGLRLTQVLVNVGDVVKAGQVLATFSQESTQADVAQARASMLEAEASAAESAANAERARTLQTSGALSAQQISQYLTLEKTARARVEAAQAVLGAQQLRGRQTRVLAPDSGVISSRSATVGAVVGSGTELFRLIRQGRLEWRAEVTASELGRITAGLPVTLYPASGGEVAGKVRMIAPSVDPLTRTALVYVDLPSMLAQRSGASGTARNSPASEERSSAERGSESGATSNGGSDSSQQGPRNRLSRAAGAAAPSSGERGSESPKAREASERGGHTQRGGHILPGMFARGDFALGASTALTIPQRALVVRDGFNYVFRLSPDNRVSQTKVQTGRLAGEQVEILSGLPADARIAVDGAGFLNDGDLVRIGLNSASGEPLADAGSAPAAIK